MNMISRTVRRAAVATATCAVVLAPAAALAASAHPAASPARAVSAAPRCATSDLTVWLGIPGEGAAGSVFYQLELSNTSHHTCTLFGFPGVSAVGLGGTQLGSPATRDSGDPEKLVTLSRGATAHVLLRIVNVSVLSGCQAANAIGLRVFPPGATTATVVSFPFQACKNKGPKFLSVRVTVTRTGIPGFSS